MILMILDMASTMHKHTAKPVERVFVGVSLWQNLVTEARKQSVKAEDAETFITSLTIHGITVRPLASLSPMGLTFP